MLFEGRWSSPLDQMNWIFQLRIAHQRCCCNDKLFFWKMVNKQHSNAKHWNFRDGFLVATTNLWIVSSSLWKVHGCVCVCVCVCWVFQFYYVVWVELPSCIRQFSQIWLKTKHEALLALPTKARILCLDSLYRVHSSLMDSDPMVVGLVLYEEFWKDDILACVETWDQL